MRVHFYEELFAENIHYSNISHISYFSHYKKHLEIIDTR